MNTMTNLGVCTGEQLLLLRILKPQMCGLIDQELDRRVGAWRLARHTRGQSRAQPRASLRLASTRSVA
jgi:hypothetical protein